MRREMGRVIGWCKLAKPDGLHGGMRAGAVLGLGASSRLVVATPVNVDIANQGLLR